MIAVTRVARAQALFASCLQPSDRPSAQQVATAIDQVMRREPTPDCACALATEYGDHPEEAAARMRWALALVAACDGAGVPASA